MNISVTTHHKSHELIDKSIPPIAPVVCGVERSTVVLCVCLK